MPNIGPAELLILVLVLVLLFGAKKLPDAARSLGRSMRIFKSEVKEMSNDDQPQPGQIAPPQHPQAQPGQQGYWEQPQNQPNPQPLQQPQDPQQYPNQPNQQ